MLNRTVNLRSPRPQPIPTRAGHTLRVSLCAVAGFFCLAQSAAAKETAAEFFEARIRPVLIRACYSCHGTDKTENGLRVHSREALLSGGERGPALIPGDANNSLLIRAISHQHEDLVMPPAQPLPRQVVNDFRQWIQTGAVWPTALAIDQSESHWSWQPRQSVTVPPSQPGASNHPIDRLVARAQRARTLAPVPQATPQALLRRLCFDLIGLPPTPPQSRDFATRAAVDPRDALESEIDRLLASSHYGERWGRHWMDVVRYADTAGDNADYPVPEAQRYRDYIIDAFNTDMPFDQFVREQLAGDLLAQLSPTERYADLITATGFLALSRRYGTAPYELWHLTLEDTIDTTGRAFMGLTLKCARCHDHKFDPISTTDYYALYGIFNSTQFPWAGGEEFQSQKHPRQHFVPLLPDREVAAAQQSYQARLQDLSSQLAQLDLQIKSAAPSRQKQLQEQRTRLTTEHLKLNRPGLPPDVPGAYAVRDKQPADVAVQIDGLPGNAGALVARNTIAFLSAQPLAIPAEQSGRLQLATWLTANAHPLTARVIANRIWQHHFGRGIVATPSNFGKSGAMPTHPQLLDYLAQRLVNSGWRIKALHRLILTSQTWQRSSASHAGNLAIDTGNAYYWRHDRRRLDAESIRDAMLSVSGQLELKRPGPHPFPPIEQWSWTQHRQFKDHYASNHRSVYLMTQRLQKHPFLELFDGPDTNTTTGKRTSATVTPQSLYMMNSPQIQNIAIAFAARLSAHADTTDERIRFAYQLCYGRSVESSELERDRSYLAAAAAALSTSSTSTETPTQVAWRSYAKLLLSANEFFYLD